ncbi:Conidiation protein 6-domain-containing protein [Amanita rubescens]|nr:Conidiation protein 6-domain-containing protein [Amanita rubescens]
MSAGKHSLWGLKLLLKELVEQVKDPSRVAAGLKAAVHNPRVSEEAKESASERLHEMGEDVEPTKETTSMLTPTSLGGNFCLLTRRQRHATEKRHAEERRQAEEKRHAEEQMMEGKTESRVMGGYKATLKNPRVSPEAKEHAEEVLEQHHVPH